MAAENILERIKRLVAEAIRSGRFKSEAEFLRAARLSSGYFGELAVRLETNPEASMLGPTANRIAEALGVPVEKILSGQSDDEPPVLDKYPGRAWAVDSARGLQIPEAAIQLVLKEDPGTDPGRMWWFRRIEAEAERVRPPPESGSHKI